MSKKFNLHWVCGKRVRHYSPLLGRSRIWASSSQWSCKEYVLVDGN